MCPGLLTCPSWQAKEITLRQPGAAQLGSAEPQDKPRPFKTVCSKKVHTYVSGCTWGHKAERSNSAPLTLQQVSKETFGQFDFEPNLMASAAWQFRWNLPERPWNFTKETGQYPCYSVMPVGYLAAVNVLLKAVACGLHNRVLGIFKGTNILLFSSQPETHPTRKTK